MHVALPDLFTAPEGAAPRPIVIADVAQTHDGSLGQAHAFVDAVARAGADAVKFQTHIAAAESTRREPWRVPFSRQDASRYDYWKRMEFTPDQWQGLADHARESGRLFISSPFSIEAVALLERLEMPLWKLASGELDNPPLHDAMLATRKPMLISTGMSDLDEVDRVAARCRDAAVPFGVLQCTTAYPCPPERVGLNVIAQLRERYGPAVGLSDHSGTIFAGLAAAALGARFIEVHVTFSREMFGPDVPASLTIDELRQLVDGVDFIHRAMTSPVDKADAARESRLLRTMFGRSVVAARDLPQGAEIASGDLALKNPGGGLPPATLNALIGRRLARAVARDEALTADDVTPRLSES